MSDEKLCPFKKGTVKRWTATLDNNNEPNQYDVFMPCEGERCMAYADGACRKLPPVEAKHHPKEATQSYCMATVWNCCSRSRTAAWT